MRLIGIGVENKLKRFLVLIVAFVLLVSALPLTTFAEDVATLPSSNSNDMARNMISFFREDRTSMDVESISHDEMKIYAVFLSNFFKPGQTKVSDLKDESLAKAVSARFFGDEKNYTEVMKIHEKLYEAVDKGFSNGDFLLKNAKNDKAAMSGKQLLSKMNATGYCYLNTDVLSFDLNSPAMNAAFKTIYGIVPDLFASKNGIYSMGGIYIDGFGNIWGNKTVNGAGSKSSDFVLILPSCINPVVFAKGSSNLKYPVTNAFSMGISMEINPTMLSEQKDLLTPYYNLKSRLPAGNSRKSMASLVGLSSPLKGIGNTDGLMLNKLNNLSSYSSFLHLDANKTNKESTSILLAIDTTAYSPTSTIYLTDLKNKSNIYSYLNKTSILGMGSLVDDMFYFNIDGMSKSASYSDGGKWKDDTSLMVSQKLFTKGGAAATTLYPNSYTTSKFDEMMLKLIPAYAKVEILKKYFPELSKTELTTFKDLLMWNIDLNAYNGDTYNALFKKIYGSNKVVYNVVKKSDYIDETALEEIGFWSSMFGSTDTSCAGWGLGKHDSAIALLSTHIDGVKWNSETLQRYNKNCFEAESPGFNTKGGRIANRAMTPDDTRGMMNLITGVYSYKLFGMNYEVRKKLDDGTAIGTSLGGYKTASGIANVTNNWAGIYWSYMHGMIDLKQDENGEWLSPKSYINKALPNITIATRGAGVSDFEANMSTDGSGGLAASQKKTDEDMQKEILTKVYGLLYEGPSQSRDSLIKVTQDSWFLSTHREITGSSVGNSLSVGAGGDNSYTGVVGYINMPSLDDLPLTAWLTSNYMYIYMFLLLLVCIILLSLFIGNMRTWQSCVLIFMLMSFVLLMPFSLINNVVNISNAASDSVYSSKFDYWAILNHQQSLKGIASKPATMETIVAKNMEQAKDMYSQDTGVRLKWMSPKKASAFSSIFTDTVNNPNIATNLAVFKWLFSGFVYGEEFVHSDPFATYLYRPYNSLAQSSKDCYAALKGVSTDTTALESLLKSSSKGVLGFDDYTFELYNEMNHTVDYSQTTKDLIKSVGVYGGINDSNAYRYWAESNSDITTAIFRDTLEIENAGIEADALATSPDANAFLLTSESPYYYFYNVLKTRYTDDGSGAGFKNALLHDEVFKIKNNDDSDVNNKVRDFLDMEGLFTHVIPYLDASNKYVYKWTSKYGRNIEEFDFDKGVSDLDIADSTFDESKARKEALKKVWYMYSPWVDQLHSLKVNNIKVKVANKKVKVGDTLNPSYMDNAGRPMLFSEADMIAKGYNVSDLSDIEFRLQHVLDETYKDMLYLVNYYDFDDEVLIVAASMVATFNFNKAFSEPKLLGESIMLYPQNFELKNFNYDAFMRLTLMNSTGESLLGGQDLYAKILSKTSIFTGISLLAKDVLGVYAVPAMNLLVLLLLLFLGLLMCVASVISKPENILKSVMKSLVIPCLLFGLVHTIFSLIVSLFVGDGLTYYVGSSGLSLSTNDPTITLLLLILVDLVYVVILLKLVRVILATVKGLGLSSVFGTLSAVAGIGASAFAFAKDRMGLRYQGKQIARGMAGMAGMAGSADYQNTSSDGDYNMSDLPSMRDADSLSANKDTGMQSYINNLTRNNASLPNSTSNTDAKKGFGSRVVDLKYCVGDSLYNARTTAKTLGGDLYDGSKKAIKGVTRLATGEVFTDMVDNAKMYESDLITSRADSYNKLDGDKKSVYRFDKENARLKKLEDSRLQSVNDSLSRFRD